jgi:DNA-binding response OmpR family regulator
MAHIFIIEDNEDLREAVVSYLKLDGHEIIEFREISGVMESIRSGTPDLIILDVMLPDGNGFQLAKEIRKKYTMPILFLTARTSESDRITGFEVGGDDYITKPFSPKELILRVKVILKRTSVPENNNKTPIEYIHNSHILRIDHLQHKAILDEEHISFTASEWKILVYLAENSGNTVQRSRILTNCLDYITDSSERTIDTHIKNIRSKLKDPGWIETVRSFGYRFLGKKDS